MDAADLHKLEQTVVDLKQACELAELRRKERERKREAAVLADRRVRALASLPPQDRARRGAALLRAAEYYRLTRAGHDAIDDPTAADTAVGALLAAHKLGQELGGRFDPPVFRVSTEDDDRRKRAAVQEICRRMPGCSAPVAAWLSGAKAGFYTLLSVVWEFDDVDRELYGDQYSHQLIEWPLPERGDVSCCKKTNLTWHQFAAHQAAFGGVRIC